MARFSHANVHKLGKSKLVVDVRHSYEEEELHPTCPPLHITFYTRNKHRYFDHRHVSLSSLSNSSLLLGKHRQGDLKTLSMDDNSIFSDIQKIANFKVAVKTVLRSLRVKKSRHGKILKNVIAFGKQCSNEKKKMNLSVKITIERNFFGDRDSVREVMEKSWEECKNKFGRMVIYAEGDLQRCVF